MQDLHWATNDICIVLPFANLALKAWTFDDKEAKAPTFSSSNITPAFLGMTTWAKLFY